MSAETATDLPRTPMVRRAAEVTCYSMSPTQEMRFLYSGALGEPDFYEERTARGDSPPLHRHPWATWELVLDGELTVLVDDEEFVVGAGDCIYTPPGAVHTYVVESPRARVVGFNTPGGRFEDLNRVVAPMFLVDGGPDMREVVARAAECGVEILGPPLAPRRS